VPRHRNRVVTLEGADPVAVARDARGIPQVSARTEPGAYRGLGFCHGRDRSIQLAITRLAGRGRMAEHLRGGDDLLEIDIAFRQLGLAVGAGEEVSKLEPGSAALVDAYCAGVNEALGRRAPWELRLAGLRRIDPWTPEDCVIVSRLAGWVSLAQSQGEMEDLLVDLVRAGVARELLEELFPGQLGGLDEGLVRELRGARRLVPEAVRWSTALPRPVASNNWALAPSRTRSGHALMANDPHLDVGRLPAVWQEVGVRAGERWFAGATMPGLPGLLVGRTNDLAWGATYAFMDATDSWIEDCRDGRCRRGDDEWVKASERVETIARRGSDPLVLSVFETDRGVLDGDPRESGLRRATRWSAGRGAGAASIEAAIAMFHARDVGEGMAAAGRIESAFNWVMADSRGSIGYQMSGLHPVRGAGASGLVPLPAWDETTGWSGWTAPEDLPRTRDPQDGIIVTANQDLGHLGRVRPQNLPMGGSRAERIERLLRERGDWDVAGVAAVQLDERSPQAERFMEHLRPLLPPGENGDLLRAWEATYPPESRAATLFERWYRALILDVVGGVAGADVARFLLDETGIVADFYANLLSERSAWFGGRTREQVYEQVALRALATPARPWGERQRVTMRHLLFGGRLPARLGFDRGPFALPGSRGTPRQGTVYRSGGRETSFAPSLRLVTDLAEEVVHSALAGGPSDRRHSRWYVSCLEDWLEGRLVARRPPAPPR
jgi:penicillin amidase